MFLSERLIRLFSLFDVVVAFISQEKYISSLFPKSITYSHGLLTGVLEVDYTLCPSRQGVLYFGCLILESRV